MYTLGCRENMMNHHRYTKSTRSFTLIEMLVVISIIGVLASTILAALGGARRQGTYAGAVQFSTELYRFMGDRAAAIFTFDEGVTNDSSGNNVSASYYPPAIGSNWATDGCFKGRCYSLPTSLSLIPAAFNQFKIKLAYASTFTPTNINTVQINTPLNLSNKFTIAFWFKTNFSGSDYSNDLILSNIVDPSDMNGRYSIGVYKGKTYAHFHSLNNSEIYLDSDSTPPTNTIINDNVWHHIAVEVNVDKVIVYVDGHLESQRKLSGGLSFNSFRNGDIIGCRTTGCSGYVDEVYYYRQAVSAEAIHAMYFAQSEEHRRAVAAALR